MFAKNVPQLALVGVRRCPPLSPSNHNILGQVSNLNNHNINLPNRFLSILPSPILASNSVSNPVVPLHYHSVQSMTSKEPPKMGSIMEHPEYKEMQEKLSTEAKSPLDIVCNHILSKELIVNQDILELDALSRDSHSERSKKGNAKIKEMEQSGAVKVGKFNIKDDMAIKRGFKALIDETAVDEAALVEELFAENEGVNRWRDKAFMLKRQLVGFWLLQFVENGNLRLPMKAYDGLGKLLLGGKFTKRDDKAILAWVDKYGETGWADLARSLGRNYLKAGAAVNRRYERLLVGNKGAFSEEEDAFIIREVIKQVPEAFEKPYHQIKVDFKVIASQMEKRTGQDVLHRIQDKIHPTIMRSKAGTLDKDVRAKLIEKIKENKWIYSADVKFDKLALHPEFEGHNGASLYRLYNSIMGMAKERFGLNSNKEVTVDQVEEWWNTSKRIPKTETQIEKEQQIVEAYFKAKSKL